MPDALANVVKKRNCIMPVARSEVRVTESHCEGAVAEQVPHRVERHSCLHQERCARVPQVMEAKVPQAGCGDGPRELAPQRRNRPTPIGTSEHRRI